MYNEHIMKHDGLGVQRYRIWITDRVWIEHETFLSWEEWQPRISPRTGKEFRVYWRDLKRVEEYCKAHDEGAHFFHRKGEILIVNSPLSYEKTKAVMEYYFQGKCKPWFVPKGEGS